MLATLRRIMEEEGNRCVLAVSHGGAIYSFLRGIGVDMNQYKNGLTNCCILKLDYNKGAFTLREYIPNPVTQ